MMTIFESLATEQREIEGLFRRLLSARAPGAQRSTFRVLSTRLLALLRNERLVVYPHFAAISGLREEVAEARRQHAEIESVIAKLRVARMSKLEWEAAAAVLHMQVRELVTLEECALYPVARLTVSSELATRLGEDFVALEPESSHIAGASITWELAS
jgi:hypothetical protein